jgi:hypothetical protein
MPSAIAQFSIIDLVLPSGIGSSAQENPAGNRGFTRCRTDRTRRSRQRETSER